MISNLWFWLGAMIVLVTILIMFIKIKIFHKLHFRAFAKMPFLGFAGALVFLRFLAMMWGEDAVMMYLGSWEISWVFKLSVSLLWAFFFYEITKIMRWKM